MFLNAYISYTPTAVFTFTPKIAWYTHVLPSELVKISPMSVKHVHIRQLSRNIFYFYVFFFFSLLVTY